MLKPICVPCQRFYRCKKTGYYFFEGMPKSGVYPVAGTLEADKWKPYKLWVGDLFECPTCGHQTIAGVNQQPISEHYMPDFAKWAEQLQPDIQINDC